MADNTTINVGSGGDTLRTEDRTTFKTPVSLIDVGGTSAESILGDAGVTLPANLRSEQVDDAAFTPATSRVLMVGAEYDDTTPDSVDEGDGGAVRMSARRELYTQIRDAAGNERGANVNASNQLEVAGPVTVAAGATNIAKAEDAASANADVGVPAMAVQKATPANTAGTDGDYEMLQMSAGRLWTSATIDAAIPAGNNNIGDVDVASSALPTGASTLAEQQSQTTHLATIAGDTTAIETAVQIIDDWDEADRAKVNLIVGQAGVAAGAGAVGATVPRVTLASDDPAVVDLAAIEVLLTTIAGDTTDIEAAVELLDDAVYTDDAAFTPGTSKVLAIGAQADETAADSVDEGDVGALRMTLDRKLHAVIENESNSIRAGGTACTPKYAVIDAATSGDNTLVAAVNPKKIRVLSCYLVASAAVTVRFESGASGTALSGQMQLAANGGFVLPYNPLGHFETASNTLLNLELSGAISVDGGLTYIEV